VLLVDTSVWIAYFRTGSKVDLAAMDEDDEIVTCLPVVQEVLQGFRDEGAYRTAHEAMLALPILESPMGSSLFVEAANLHRQARRTGVTVRSSVDCLVAACALRNDAVVVHTDRDYDALARACALRVRRLRLR
jgi:predicted nucleic acid-binding protein